MDFLQTYGLWILLGGVFFVMHRRGSGCCGPSKAEPVPVTTDEPERDWPDS